MITYTFSDTLNLKEVSEVDLFKYIKKQKTILNCCSLAKNQETDESKKIDEKAIKKDIEILQAEQDRRENFREYIDWNDPKEPPNNDRIVWARLCWDKAWKEGPVICEQAYWIKRENKWNIISNKYAIGMIVVAWTEIPKGPKGSF